ncbi:flavin-containing monooxygenase [Oligoflexus tunisiensis]|uniref:flavin-containing monooxygenase n=1 Tax=Oligoflexus tunisiensis TaxID=708132 RepID=UPI000AFFB0B8|nr:NAD(P)-binding domain-containing protein [Oligoflexus tunisiensis]
MTRTLPKVAIIGAGSSGMIACRELKVRGIPFDCFEKGSQAGGNWIFKNDNGMSAAYRSLHINTSRQQMEFLCFPMPRHYPTYPHHSQIAEYFDAFLDHFRLKEDITFNTEVKKAEPQKDGSWQLTLANGTQPVYDAVIVANGHHWDPRWPEPAFPGEFHGITMHSHAYLDPTEPHELIDRNVLVVGMGNSAMDIACELGNRGVARNVYLSARSGTHIMPKFFGSRPADAFLRHPGREPFWWEHIVPYQYFEKVAFPLISWKIRRAVGRPEDYGLPKPRHAFGMAHPTISSEVHIRLGSGDIKPKPNIKELQGDRVQFVDGSVVPIDAIIYATGYKISFPFFDKTVLPYENNDLPLFKRMMSPRYDNLLFLGLVQPLCSIMPIAELQASFMGDYLLGTYRLPDKDTMDKVMRAEHEMMKRRYTDSQRHTIQINCLEYSYDLRKEFKEGRKRAERWADKPERVPTTFPSAVRV